MKYLQFQNTFSSFSCPNSTKLKVGRSENTSFVSVILFFGRLGQMTHLVVKVCWRQVTLFIKNMNLASASWVSIKSFNCKIQMCEGNRHPWDPTTLTLRAFRSSLAENLLHIFVTNFTPGFWLQFYRCNTLLSLNWLILASRKQSYIGDTKFNV